jgi:hypothetical protein
MSIRTTSQCHFTQFTKLIQFTKESRWDILYQRREGRMLAFIQIGEFAPVPGKKWVKGTTACKITLSELEQIIRNLPAIEEVSQIKSVRILIARQCPFFQFCLTLLGA